MTATFQPKVILITGASSGIGEATARRLAGEGHYVVVGARRTERLVAIVGQIRAAGDTADCFALDVTSLDSMHEFAAFADDIHGRIDVIVHIPSVGGNAVGPAAAVYCATRSAAGAIFDGLRQEAGADIPVTVMAPCVATPGLADALADPVARVAMRTFREQTIPAAF